MCEFPVCRGASRSGEHLLSFLANEAILDRLLHHCEVISINGPSYRLKNRLKAIERETDVA
ncbi:hypothetical protein GCM10010377_52430 [Streptomyces viridiviolaceus]|nr:hypothetical protein GCM10010377_52430 [Streptomyces viridiviolaceus]